MTAGQTMNQDLRSLVSQINTTMTPLSQPLQPGQQPRGINIVLSNQGNVESMPDVSRSITPQHQFLLREDEPSEIENENYCSTRQNFNLSTTI